MRFQTICAVIILGWPAMTAGFAATQDRVAKGHELARQWCTGCHIIEPGSASASDVAPPFPKIAQDKRLTPEQLRVWLTNPHPPMPNLSLSREEIDNLVAYIGSLRISE
jgi:mono/diheme cytochrome c family protein